MMVCGRAGVRLNTSLCDVSAYFHIKYSCVVTQG